MEYMDGTETEREGFFEKMWKDFVSLQRGDAKKMCTNAARYQWLRDGNNDLEGICQSLSGEDMDKAIDDALVVPNNKAER